MHILTPFFFFFNDTATTEIYTLSLHDALPIWPGWRMYYIQRDHVLIVMLGGGDKSDRKSTRLNSSHQIISYAVFCLKKKNSSAVAYNSMTASSLKITT